MQDNYIFENLTLNSDDFKHVEFLAKAAKNAGPVITILSLFGGAVIKYWPEIKSKFDSMSKRTVEE